MRPECSFSLELKMTMNLHSSVIKIEDHFRFAEVIDAEDDERRKKSFALDEWNDKMLGYFIKLLDESIEDKDWEAVSIIRNEIKIFKKDYGKKRKHLQELELHYEELDDNLREWIMNYLAKCLERIGDESSQIEARWLKESVNKKFKG